MGYFVTGTILGIITCLAVESNKAWDVWKHKWS